MGDNQVAELLEQTSASQSRTEVIAIARSAAHRMHEIAEQRFHG
jgi:hypothetical protein